MKAATESSDKEKTHALPDGNIDLKEDFNIIFKMEAKHDFKVKDDFQDDFKALKGDFDFKMEAKRDFKVKNDKGDFDFRVDFKDKRGSGKHIRDGTCRADGKAHQRPIPQHAWS